MTFYSRLSKSISPYLRLMRADKPTGTWLLLLPCWQSLALALAFYGMELDALWLFAMFAVGAFVMRGAGCAYNDWVDRDIDKQVIRTRGRPIASGEITRMQAGIFIGVLCAIGFLVLLSFQQETILLGIASLILVAIYPWAKRFTWWPQLFLGLAFNWGALMGWVAYTGAFDLRIVALYASGIFWTLGYDTIYAHQDREDDALVGVKSSARVLGARTRPALIFIYTATVILAGMAGYGLHWPFWVGLCAYAVCLGWQVYRLDIHDPARCLELFRFNRFTGLVLFGAIMASVFL